MRFKEVWSHLPKVAYSAPGDFSNPVYFHYALGNLPKTHLGYFLLKNKILIVPTLKVISWYPSTIIKPKNKSSWCIWVIQSLKRQNKWKGSGELRKFDDKFYNHFPQELQLVYIFGFSSVVTWLPVYQLKQSLRC